MSNAAGRKPNILFIISDEHAPQTIGCMGADFAHTPTMDRLAERGTLFTNTYCNAALCVPSRASMMSGLLCDRIGMWDNGAALPSNFPTWAHMMRDAGYRTVLDGKMHFCGPDQLHGFEEHWLEAADPIWSCRRGEEAPDGTAYKLWSHVHIRPDDTFASDRTSQCRYIKPNGRPDKDYHYIDVARKDAAVEFLSNQSADEPFCLTVGFIYPHYPQICSESAFHLYDGVDIPAPTPRGDLSKRVRAWSDEVWGFNSFPPEQIPRARQAYMAMVTMLDGWIAEVLDALERSGLAENTIVIYSSDHGDMWGEHELWGKCLHYEQSTRVPLIVSAPSLGVQQGARIDAPVSLLDVYPTFRDIIGAEDWCADLDGRSLWAACRGAEELKDVPVFCDYYGSDTEGSERMVRYKQYKLNYYHRQGIELFDLSSDPHEQVNLADDPAYAEVREELLAMCMADWDVEAIDAAVLADQNRRVLINR